MQGRRIARATVVVLAAVIAILTAACSDDDAAQAAPESNTVGDSGADVVDDGPIEDDGAPIEIIEVLNFPPAVDEPADGPIFLLPEALDPPHEIEIALNASGPAAGTTGATSAVVLAVPTDDGVRDVVLIAVEEGVESDRNVSDSERLGLTIVGINGVDARFGESSLGTTVDWFADGRSVGVFGPPGATELVLAVARGIDPLAQGSEVIRQVPEGHVAIAAAYVSAAGEDDPSNDETNWTLRVDVGGESLSITATSTPVDFVPVIGAAIGATELVTVDVRGTTGAWTTRVSEVTTTDDTGVIEMLTTTLSWIERPGLGVTIRSAAELDTLLAVAESLVEVSEAEFDVASPLSDEPSPLPAPG